MNAASKYEPVAELVRNLKNLHLTHQAYEPGEVVEIRVEVRMSNGAASTFPVLQPNQEHLLGFAQALATELPKGSAL